MNRTEGLRRVERSGTDRDAAAALWTRLYDGHDVRFGATDTFAFRHRIIVDGPVTLITSAVTTTRTGIFAPTDRTVLAWSSTGGIRIDDEPPTSAGSPITLPVDQPFTAHVPAGTLQLLSIDAAFMDTVHGGLLHTASHGASYRREPLEAMRPALSAGIAAVAAHAFHPSADTVERDATHERLAEAVLHAFAVAVPAPESIAATGARAVYDAKVWLRENFAQPVRLDGLCDQVGVSARTLQENFRRREGMTPMEYLRGVRLDHVRAVLRRSDAHDLTVTSVARDAGFRHMGRFSGAYFERFGEYPRRTLESSSTARLTGIPAVESDVMTARTGWQL